jgi:hypothetical protein
MRLIMANDAPTSIASLPVEMLDNVFAYVRTPSDQCNICLVSHQWRDVMAPRLFRTLLLQQKTENGLTALIHPSSEILKHLRNLVVETSINFSEDDLKLLLAALPRDQLKYFKYRGDTPLALGTLQLLLQCHRALEDLYADEVQGFAAVEHFAAIAPLLGSFRRFKVCVPKPLATQALATHLKDCRILVKNMPKLVTLEVHGHPGKTRPGRYDQTDVASFFMDKDSSIDLSGLKELCVESIRMTPNYDCLLNSVDVFTLRTMTLQRCGDQISLLKAMSDVFASQESRGFLKTLRLEYDWSEVASTEIATAIGRFLEVCPRLSHLDVRMANQPMIDKKSIIANAATLQTLQLRTGYWPRHHKGQNYSSQDVKAIVDACTRLELLGLELPPAKLGTVDELPEDFRLSRRTDRANVNTELEAFVSALSSNKSIQCLRMLNLPIVEYNTAASTPITVKEAAWCRHTFANFATEVMRFMDDCGSSVRLLQRFPYSSLRDQPAPSDVDGHKWPYYTYLKGRVTDSRGASQTVACPLPGAGDEYPLLWRC